MCVALSAAGPDHACVCALSAAGPDHRIASDSDERLGWEVGASMTRVSRPAETNGGGMGDKMTETAVWFIRDLTVGGGWRSRGGGRQATRRTPAADGRRLSTPVQDKGQIRTREAMETGGYRPPCRAWRPRKGAKATTDSLRVLAPCESDYSLAAPGAPRKGVKARLPLLAGDGHSNSSIASIVSVSFHGPAPATPCGRWALNLSSIASRVRIFSLNSHPSQSRRACHSVRAMGSCSSLIRVTSPTPGNWST